MTNLNLKIKERPPAEENLGSFYMGRMRPSNPPRRILPRGALTFTTLFAFAAIIWYAYPRGQERYSDIDIPVISADKAVYKFKPDDPGGMEVLHQDSTVFDPLEKKAVDTVDKVRPKPEEPMVKPQAAKVAPVIDQTPHTLALQEVSHGSEKIIAAPEEKPAPVKKEEVKAATPAPKPVETAKTEAAKPVTAKPQPAKPEAVKPQATAKQEAVKPVPPKAEAVKPQPVKMAAVKASAGEAESILPAPVKGEPPKGEAIPAIDAVSSEPLTAPAAVEAQPMPKAAAKAAVAAAAAKPAAKTAAKPVSSASGVFIQFGAYRDDKGAREEWATLGKKFPDLLKGLSMRTEQAVGAKGTLTRLQAGRLPEARAKQVCDGMKAAKAACIIVRE